MADTPIYRGLLDGGLGAVLYELKYTVVNRRALFARWWKEGGR